MKLFGYSISINILILIGILYLIMVVNALSSSCNREGLGDVKHYPVTKPGSKSGKKTQQQYQTEFNTAKRQEMQNRTLMRTIYNDAKSNKIRLQA